MATKPTKADKALRGSLEAILKSNKVKSVTVETVKPTKAQLAKEGEWSGNVYKYSY